MKNNYKVYVHIFPDGKRYVGCTGTPLKTRWNGGMGYEGQPVFSAILRYGWNNVRHYILIENLAKEDALLYESAFIRGWKTYTKSKGYNTIAPMIDGADDINIPTFQSCKKKKIDDFYPEDTSIRFHAKYSNPNRKTKSVRCVESGEVFDNADAASKAYSTGNAKAVQYAIYSGSASGTCLVYDDEIKCNREVPAHWEYVN